MAPIPVSKQQLKNHLIELVEADISSFVSAVNALNTDAQNETKSSAGDKYETSLEMLKQEQNKLSERLKQAQHRKHILGQLSTQPSQLVAPGALFLSRSQWFYLSVALGKVSFKGVTIFCISPQAPIAQGFIGKKQLSSVVFQGKTYTIEELL